MMQPLRRWPLSLSYSLAVCPMDSVHISLSLSCCCYINDYCWPVYVCNDAALVMVADDDDDDGRCLLLYLFCLDGFVNGSGRPKCSGVFCFSSCVLASSQRNATPAPRLSSIDCVYFVYLSISVCLLVCLSLCLWYAARLSERTTDAGQVCRHVQNVFPQRKRRRILRSRLPHVRHGQERLHRFQSELLLAIFGLNFYWYHFTLFSSLLFISVSIVEPEIYF